MEENDKQPAWSRLWEAESKLKAIAFLTEAQDPNCPLPLPWDHQDVNAGLGRILWELAEQVADIRRDLEGQQIKKAKADPARSSRTQQRSPKKSLRK